MTVAIARAGKATRALSLDEQKQRARRVSEALSELTDSGANCLGLSRLRGHCARARDRVVYTQS